MGQIALLTRGLDGGLKGIEEFMQKERIKNISELIGVARYQIKTVVKKRRYYHGRGEYSL